MANNTSVSLDKWREYFRSANSDIFGIIRHAIMVAASDCPYDFKLNRDRIAELLFACKSTKCFGCDRSELALPNDHDSVATSSEDRKYKSGIESQDTKESKANSCREVMNVNRNQVSNCTYGDAEALTDEIEEETQIFSEVLRIKETLDNFEDESRSSPSKVRRSTIHNDSDGMLFDSLKTLQLMPLSLETLKATEIGKSVNALRKHGSKDIRNLVRTLIEDWKILVDAFYSATAAIAGAEVTPESGKKSVVEKEEEEGLPSPPLDEGAFLTIPNAMELSQFFDGMDDDGNLQNSGESNKNRDNNVRRHNVVETEKTQRKQETVLKQTPPCKPNRRNGVESGPGRPKSANVESRPGRPKPVVQCKSNNEIKVLQKSDKGAIQRKPSSAECQKSNCDNETSVRVKLEAAKRKLQERYQEAENAKKQRTIQVVELSDLPKQSIANRYQNMRPGNRNRHRADNRM